ncbi:MAG: beta-ketoacyl-ACP synthase III [Thermodesulfobacteriota bacterium]|nr:beta-ketoacyl-ACP synthase III [Thermodesulfobacteriota bacterium]
MKNNPLIRGMGFYGPKKILTNADLEKMVDTSDEWIITRTGIKERHMAAPGEATSDIALQACKKALADARVAPEELTHVILSTLTPDGYCPPAGCRLAQKLGIRGDVMAFDVNGACSGFLYGLQTARAMVALDPEAKVLLTAAEHLTSRVNWEDRATCVLFGDGAGAVVITGPENKGSEPEILDVILGSDGKFADLLTVNGGGSGWPYKLGEQIGENFFIQMNGREVFKVAVRIMEAVSWKILDKHGLKPEDIDLFVAHQANLRIITHVGKKLGFPPEKVFVNVDRFGNTSAAAVAIALAEAKESGAIRPGNLVLLTTFGGGFTWGSALLQF